MPTGCESGPGKAQGSPRIGIFICHCGVNIGGFVDVPQVVEYASTLDGVVHAEHNLYSCAEDGLQAIRQAIKDQDLDRVIVASCTPRTHEPLFRKACVDAGLNRYLFEMVNIREQCSWVHMEEREKATEKAKDLVRMAVAKAKMLEPLEEGTVEVTPAVMVIGGGVTGLSAAMSVAEQGFKVFVIEREEVLGGTVKDLSSIGPSNRTPGEVLDHLEGYLRGSERAEIMTSSEITSIFGYIGNFEVKVRSRKGDRTLDIGTIIVATGAEPLVPDGLYGYGKVDGVIMMRDLEEKGLGDGVKDLVIIQCVGSRGDRVSYCSRICCNVAIKNALAVKEGHPSTNVTVLHRDIMAYGVENEELYVRARAMGVRFLRFSKDRGPEVLTDDQGARVRIFNEPFGRMEELRADRVVLSTPLVPRPGADTLSQMLKVPLGQDGFFLEAHVKLRPIDFATDGIFLAGSCRAPCSVSEAVLQGRAAASRATIAISKGKVLADGAIATVDPEVCWGCGTCVEVCPYGAPALVEESGRKVSVITKVLCKGCGVCVVNCPVTAITAKHFTHDQIISMIESLGQGTGGDAHGGP